MIIFHMVLVSIIIPIHNGSKWIESCFESILHQKVPLDFAFEICVYNDSSTDNTEELLDKWIAVFQNHNIELRIYKNKNKFPGGVGFSKNRAVEISKANYLCFQDIDDQMMPNRLYEQYKTAERLPTNTLIGSRFERLPKDSTPRYTKWANFLPQSKLTQQIFTSHGPTLIMPTWFCHRSVFNRVGGFSEAGRGTPEDLIFFYKHLDCGGKLDRVDSTLISYTYHPDATTFAINENTIWSIRLRRLEDKVLSHWDRFTIWNAGKQGRKLYNSLSKASQEKVVALCDVDAKKIGRMYEPFNPDSRTVGRTVPIICFEEAQPPFVICVKMDLTEGAFEKNLAKLKMQEGVDYVMFS